MQSSTFLCLLLVSCRFLGFNLRPWKYVPPKCRLTFIGLQGVVSQKTKLFRNVSRHHHIKNGSALYPDRSYQFLPVATRLFSVLLECKGIYLHARHKPLWCGAYIHVAMVGEQLVSIQVLEAGISLTCLQQEENLRSERKSFPSDLTYSQSARFIFPSAVFFFSIFYMSVRWLLHQFREPLIKRWSIILVSCWVAGSMLYNFMNIH
jgi:hypothetical protein